MKVNCSIVADPRLRPTKAGKARKSDRQDVDQRGAKKGADDAAETADDDHEQQQEGQVDVERLGLSGAKPKEHHQSARHPDIEGRNREGEQFGAKQAMPISCAAISISRTAIHIRPMRPCTMLEASHAIAATIVSTTR